MIRRNQTRMAASSTPTSSPLSIRKDSQTIITKEKPKIRIIHIFAPEIIKTDVANFRELVQRLTGKPSHQDHKGTNCKNKPIISRSNCTEDQPRITGFCDNKPTVVAAAAMAKKMELRTGIFAGLETRERVKEEDDEGMWNSEINSGGFLSGFGDLDGFIQELGEFPFLPNLDASSHNMHGFEEAQLA